MGSPDGRSPYNSTAARRSAARHFNSRATRHHRGSDPRLAPGVIRPRRCLNILPAFPARVRVANLPSHSKTFDGSLFTVSSRAFSELTSVPAWSPLWTVFAALPPDERICERVTRSLIETPEGCTSSTKTIPTSDFRSSRPGNSTIRLKVVTHQNSLQLGTHRGRFLASTDTCPLEPLLRPQLRASTMTPSG